MRPDSTGPAATATAGPSAAAPNARPAMIAVDWGTTSCRFVLVAADGSALDRRGGPGLIPLQEASEGRTADRAAAFEQALRDRVGDWLREHPGIPLVMCGMVGAEQGWRDAGYRELPASLVPALDALVEVTVPGHPAYLVPGVMQRDPAPDVMRGEETQVLGALLQETGAAPWSAETPASAGAGQWNDALVIAPGTHSKWVRVSGGRIQHFRTYMTGDLFAALSGHTILAATIDDEQSRAGSGPSDAGSRRAASAAMPSEAFTRGLDLALDEDRPSLSRHLFRARSSVLLGDLAPAETHDFLSGLVIGDEVHDALDLLAPDESVRVLLIASDQLAPRYRAALERAGVRVHLIPGDPATRGLHVIARQLTDATPNHHSEEHPRP